MTFTFWSLGHDLGVLQYAGPKGDTSYLVVKFQEGVIEVGKDIAPNIDALGEKYGISKDAVRLHWYGEREPVPGNMGDHIMTRVDNGQD